MLIGTTVRTLCSFHLTQAEPMSFDMPISLKITSNYRGRGLFLAI